MATDKESLIFRLRAACNGLPGAVIAWPHRILHEAAEELAAANARIAELEARCAKYKAIIDRAPHHESCGFWVGMFKKHCDCWKKGARTEGGGHG